MLTLGTMRSLPSAEHVRLPQRSRPSSCWRLRHAARAPRGGYFVHRNIGRATYYQLPRPWRPRPANVWECFKLVDCGLDEALLIAGRVRIALVHIPQMITNSRRASGASVTGISVRPYLSRIRSSSAFARSHGTPCPASMSARPLRTAGHKGRSHRPHRPARPVRYARPSDDPSPQPACPGRPSDRHQVVLNSVCPFETSHGMCLQCSFM